MFSRSDWLTLAMLAAIATALNLIAFELRSTGLVVTVAYSALALFFVAAVAFVGFWLFFFRMIARKEQKPLAATVLWLRNALPRLFFAACAMEIISLGLSGFTSLKIALPSVRPFYDHALASIDGAIIGAAPWASWAASKYLLRPIDAIYGCWSLVQAIFTTIVALSPLKAVRDRAMVSYMLIWSAGIAVAYVMPAAGPLFYDRVYGGAHYAALDSFLRGSATQSIASYLWSSGGKIGGGIFAMPSIHVAGALWIVLVVRELWPRAVPLAAVYAAVIAFGSVFLGWHYVLDGLVGAGLAIGCWQISAGAMRASHHPSGRLLPS